MGTGRGLHPAYDEPHRRGVGLTVEGGVAAATSAAPSIRTRIEALVQAGDGEAARPPRHGCRSRCRRDRCPLAPPWQETVYPSAAWPSARRQCQRPRPAAAALASVAVVARRQPVGLADGGIKINGEWCVAGSRPSGPGPGQQLTRSSSDVAPPEAAQERPQGGGRLDHATESASRCRADVPKSRCHQGQHFVGSPARAFNASSPSPRLGEGDRKEQPSIGHQAVVSKATWMRQAAQMVASFGCSSFRVGLVSAKPLSPKPGALSYPFSTPLLLSLRWIGAKLLLAQFRGVPIGCSSGVNAPQAGVNTRDRHRPWRYHTPMSICCCPAILSV